MTNHIHFRLVQMIIVITGTLLVLMSGTLAHSGDRILGKKPGYGWGSVSSVPNRQAIGTIIWVPGLDEGYIPQGMTFAEGQLLIGVYQSTDVKKVAGPSKVFRVDPNTGDVTGQFDLPPDVGHADGLAYGGNNILYVADSVGLDSARSRKIYKLDLEKAIKKGNCDEAVLGKMVVDRSMGPAFLTYDGKYLWFGQYVVNKSDMPRMYKVNPEDVFKEWPSVSRVSPAMVLISFEIDAKTQGATFDKEGNLWLSQSDSEWGKLQKVDPSNGKVLKEYELMAGAEDMAVSFDGKLWATSEAGTKKFYKWRTYYPVIFEIDIAKLK